MTHFKNRGHFCNYCRVIIHNKCRGYTYHGANEAIWWAWDHPEDIPELLLCLKSLPADCVKVKDFNKHLRALRDRFFQKAVKAGVDWATWDGKLLKGGL